MLQGSSWSDGTIGFLQYSVTEGLRKRRANDFSVVIYALIEILHEVEYFMLWEQHGKPGHGRVGPSADPKDKWPWEPVASKEFPHDLRADRRHAAQTPPFGIYWANIARALAEASCLGICKNRLWNVVMGSVRTEYDIVGLVASIKSINEPSRLVHTESIDCHPSITIKSPNQVDKSHASCSVDLCHFASLDNTKVRGLHKCRD